ncbi:MAG: DegT/DnrJ/EryC1/StrS family aminotransferase [Bacteroidota bacterium]
MIKQVAQQIQMVELAPQYEKIKAEVDAAIAEVIESTRYIGGPKVAAFQQHLEDYLQVKHVIPCANGTDALQIAMMALDLQPGDEVIVPSFTYVATAEVIGLLRLKPVMVDVGEDTFNVTADIIEAAITDKTKAIVPVHLFGQSADMEPILTLSKRYNIPVIEDNAQAIGADYTFSDGTTQKTGTLGDIGCTSFFPSKNLGCYGDGGAIFTNSENLYGKLKMIANHGQSRQYYHDKIGVNSRLDALQAAILDIKLHHLDEYNAARQAVAAKYDGAFAEVEQLQTPVRQHNSTHVFHQYTLKVKDGRRDELKQSLAERDIPAMIYYPVPLYKQKAYAHYFESEPLPVTERITQEVISLPIHTEMREEVQAYIIENVLQFFE